MQKSANELHAWCRSQLHRLQPLAASGQKEPVSEISLQALRAEASHRQFYRVQSNTADESWVAMYSPPAQENNAQFVALAEVFAGLGTPRVLAEDHDQGFFLMEDLGQHHLLDAYHRVDNSPDHLAQCINLALDGLIPFQGVQHPLIPAYDSHRLSMEFDLCGQWLIENLLALPLNQQDLDTLQQSKHLLIDAMLEQPRVCVHRDFHCRNLLITGSGQSQALGIVDFQDALIGPALYDPASLLRDCYYTHEEGLIAKCLMRFAARNPELTDVDPKTLTWWLDACAAQRQIKAIGIFARLHLRDNKSSHLGYILPTLQRLVVMTANYPKLTRLSQLLARWSETASNIRLLSDQEIR